MKATALFALVLFMSNAAHTQAANNYQAIRTTVDGVEVIRLTDVETKTEVSIAPSLGNNAYEMKVNGSNIFWFPFKTLAEYKLHPTMAGTPFLAPWANRLDHEGFFANGKEYKLNAALNNFRTDAFKQPIHGLLVYTSEWHVEKLQADTTGAFVTSRLDFWKHPDWMAQFPFAHSILITHRLSKGVLEVSTSIENLSSENLPISVGYHPYFQIHDSPRDQWKVALAAKDKVTLTSTLVPDGTTKPLEQADALGLSGIQLDDVLTTLIRGSDGRAAFSVTGVKQKISVLYGALYPVAVVYAPGGRDFICFEPMSGPTNAFNLHQAGKYKELQTVAPGQTWHESFWIQPTGF